MATADLTQARLRELLHYDSDTGVFTRLNSRKRTNAQGAVGSLYSCGYVYISLAPRRYIAHRLAWLYVHGYMPSNDLDHINGDRADNRIANLRECTRAENMQNYKKPRTNTSGFIGVHWRAKDNRWTAVINSGRKAHHLGLFSTPEEAASAYLAAKSRLHAMNPVPR
jgi:hypothetical protein